MILRNSENNIHDMRPFCRPLFCHSSAMLWIRGRNQLFISGGKFHEFSFDDTYNGSVFLPPDTKSIVQTYTFCTTLVNKNRQNRTFYNSVVGWINGVKRNFWLHAMCACTEEHSTYQIRWENWWLGHRIWRLGKCVWLDFMLQLEKEK